MGLKRHPALQPFSRDHLIGLFHAQRLIKLEEESSPDTFDQTVLEFADAWEREIVVHFADEDRLIGPLPLSTANLERLESEHIELTALIQKVVEKPYSLSLAAQVGQILDAHIRWEEHELFPEIETTLSANELESLGEQTALVEASRKRKLI